MTRALGPRAVALALAGLAVACYAGTLGHGFVYDDVQNVVDNRWIRSVRYLPQVLFSHAAGFDDRFATGYYRPLMHGVYLATYQVAGLRPWAFHLVNVLLHAAATVLAFLVVGALVRRLGPEAVAPRAPAIAALAAALFAIHPVHTEAVAWIAGVTDLSFTVFALVSILLYVRADGSRRGIAAAAVAFFVATLGKEPALVVPALLVVYEVARRAAGTGIPLRTVARRLAPFAAVVAAYLAIRVAALGAFAPGMRVYRLDAGTIVLTAADLFTRYLRMLVWPNPLSALYSFVPVTSALSTAGAVALAGVAAAGTAVWWARRRPLILVAAAFIALPLLPVLYIPAVDAGVFAERYLYLPVLGYAMLAGIAVVTVASRGGTARVATIAVVALVGALMVMTTVERNAVWRDSVSLWSDTVMKSPGSAVAHESLCWALSTERRHAEAIRACERALALEPGRLDARVNLAYALAESGRTDDAITHYQTVARARPDDADALTGLGLAYMAKGWTEAALTSYRAAIRARPEHAEAHNDLGVALVRAGRLGEAIPHLREAARLQPDNADYAGNVAAASPGVP